MQVHQVNHDGGPTGFLMYTNGSDAAAYHAGTWSPSDDEHTMGRRVLDCEERRLRGAPGPTTIVDVVYHGGPGAGRRKEPYNMLPARLVVSEKFGESGDV